MLTIPVLAASVPAGHKGPGVHAEGGCFQQLVPLTKLGETIAAGVEGLAGGLMVIQGRGKRRKHVRRALTRLCESLAQRVREISED